MATYSDCEQNRLDSRANPPAGAVGLGYMVSIPLDEWKALVEAARFARSVLLNLPPTELSEEMAIGKLNDALQREDSK